MAFKRTGGKSLTKTNNTRFSTAYKFSKKANFDVGKDAYIIPLGLESGFFETPCHQVKPHKVNGKMVGFNNSSFAVYIKCKGIDEEGNYIYSDESISPEFAFDIQSREGYTQNVGTMAVGLSDAHIWKLLKDPEIRSISPYHKSGINPLVAKTTKASEFTDYTNEQIAVTPKEPKNETESWSEYYDRLTARKDGAVPKIGVKAVVDFNLYDDLLETENPIETSRNYVEYCQSNGIVPKFAAQ